MKTHSYVVHRHYLFAPGASLSAQAHIDRQSVHASLHDAQEAAKDVMDHADKVTVGVVIIDWTPGDLSPHTRLDEDSHPSDYNCAGGCPTALIAQAWLRPYRRYYAGRLHHDYYAGWLHMPSAANCEVSTQPGPGYQVAGYPLRIDRLCGYRTVDTIAIAPTEEEVATNAQS